MINSIWNKIKSSHTKVFRNIYRNNDFKGKDSISGPGSDFEQTRVIRIEIPKLLKELKAHTLLDIPCGDFNWMKLVDPKGFKYIGGDIVKELIDINQENYSNKDRSFFQLDLLNDSLPNADILLCRDCLVHLSYNHLFKALTNIRKSSISYILTTSFTSRKENIDINTGNWRPLNLILPPFSFPNPLKIINEECTENDGIYKDKSLLLWKVSDLPDYRL